MKKILTLFGITLLLWGLSTFPLKADAAEPSTPQTNCTTSQFVADKVGTPLCQSTDAEITANTKQEAQTAVQIAQNANEIGQQNFDACMQRLGPGVASGIACGGVGVGAGITGAAFGALGNALGWLFGGVAWLVLKIITAVVWVLVENVVGLLAITGWLFNFVIDTMVVNMGQFINGASAQGVRTAWTIVRDLANIGIVGGMIAIAISTILQIQAYSANKLLARLIIAALLVNFSYFFAGTIIDASNYLAATAYKSVLCQGTIDCTSTTIADAFQDLVASQYLIGDTHGLLQAAGTENSKVTTDIVSSAGYELLFYILFLILTLVTIFVFLSAIALLIGRFVSLIFVLIASPLGIVGLGIPLTFKYARQWWKILFAQAFFAPIYLLLVGFSLQILESAKGVFTTRNNYGGSVVGILITFIVATTFMLMSLKVAKKMSEVGTEQGANYLGAFYKAAQALAGWAPGLYRYGLRTAASETLGRLGGEAGEYYRQHIAPRLKFFGRPVHDVPILAALDRQLQAGLDRLGGAKFGDKTFPSYLETKAARTERTKGLSKQERVLEQEEERKKAEALVQERKTQVDEEAAEDERQLVPPGKEGQGSSGGRGSAPSGPSGGGGGVGGGGRLPSTTGPTRGGGGGTAGTGRETQNRGVPLAPGSRPPPRGATETKADEQGKNVNRAALASVALRRLAVARNGVPETEGQTAARLAQQGITRESLLTADGKNLKTSSELLRDFGDRIKTQMPDGTLESHLQFESRYNRA